MLLFACATSETETIATQVPNVENEEVFSYLALGDSYTIGESVPVNENFPAQLSSQLNEQLEKKTRVEIVATTGWRTDDLINAVNSRISKSDYDVVTLLIGVNNQYQNRPFSQYEEEFVVLLEKAIAIANGDKDRVFVISIPDYAYTPFGANADRETISSELNRYNAYANEKAVDKGVRFINITDITRKGLDEPELVAGDGLHPSGEAYSRFVERILPFVRTKLQE